MKRVAATIIAVCVSGASIALAQSATGSLAPVEPTTHTVQMVLEDGKYRFEPAEIKARAGDRVTFVMVSGGPHNIAFDPERVPAAAKAALSRALPDRMLELAGPLLTTEGAKYTIVLDGVPAGRYPFYCMPHMGVSMSGTLVVE